MYAINFRVQVVGWLVGWLDECLSSYAIPDVMLKKRSPAFKSGPGLCYILGRRRLQSCGSSIAERTCCALSQM